MPWINPYGDEYHDNNTGKLADQWLLSAIGILTGHPHLLRSLFLPTRQEEVGRYCVRLFKEANWTNVFVDNLVACNASGDVRMKTLAPTCSCLKRQLLDARSGTC